MSRNKDIELLHSITGKSYSSCRARMKQCNWNVVEAMFYDVNTLPICDAFNDIGPAVANICSVLGDLCHSIGDTCYSVADSIMKEGQNGGSIDN